MGGDARSEHGSRYTSNVLVDPNPKVKKPTMEPIMKSPPLEGEGEFIIPSPFFSRGSEGIINSPSTLEGGRIYYPLLPLEGAYLLSPPGGYFLLVPYRYKTGP